MRTKYRDQLKKYLKNNGIDTAVHYPIPIHKQVAFKKQFGLISLPRTEKYSKEILSLPINSQITISEINYVIKKIKFF